MKLSDYGAKVTVISIWGAFCMPCRKELPFVEALYRACKADPDVAVLTLVDTEVAVVPLAEPVLGHRLIISPAARIRNVTAPTVMSDILNAVPVPGARAGRRFERDAVAR